MCILYIYIFCNVYIDDLFQIRYLPNYSLAEELKWGKVILQKRNLGEFFLGFCFRVSAVTLH